MNVGVGITAVVVGSGAEIVGGGSDVGKKAVAIGSVVVGAGSGVGATSIVAGRVALIGSVWLVVQPIKRTMISGKLKIKATKREDN
jgi:hypothetical protein